MLCYDKLTESSAETRTFAGLTVYKRVSDAGPLGKQWKQLAALTPESPRADGKRHTSGQLSSKHGHLRIELVKPEDCSSSQFLCVTVVRDKDDQMTLKKAVVRAKTEWDSSPDLKIPVRDQPLSSPAEQSGLARQLDILTATLSEKLRCIDTRLSDSVSREGKLEDKLEDLKDSMADRMNSLEKSVGTYLLDSETRVHNKIDYVRDRLEDKISDEKTFETLHKPNSQIYSDECTNIGAIEKSLQSIVSNFTSIGVQINRVESAVRKSLYETSAVDNKLKGVASGVSSLSTLTNNLTTSVGALSKRCVAGETASPVEEFFDALGNGRKTWRLAFRGTAYNNVQLYPAYLHGTGIPAQVEIGCKQFNHSLPCVNHYRNWDALENWSNVDEVLFAIYVRGQMVKHIIFNGRGSMPTSWFTPNRVIVTSWGDLRYRTHNHFSVKGDDKPDVMRRFLVNHFNKNCKHDKGWFMVGDIAPGLCSWEHKLTRPAFLYATGKTFTLWRSKKVGRADSIGIYLKYY